MYSFNIMNMGIDTCGLKVIFEFAAVNISKTSNVYKSFVENSPNSNNVFMLKLCLVKYLSLFSGFLHFFM